MKSIQEHSGNDPNAKLVPHATPGIGWTKPVEKASVPSTSVNNYVPAGLHTPPAIGPTLLADGLPDSTSAPSLEGRASGISPAVREETTNRTYAAPIMHPSGSYNGHGMVAGRGSGRSVLQEREFPALQEAAKHGGKVSETDTDSIGRDSKGSFSASKWEEDERAHANKPVHFGYQHRPRHAGDDFMISQGFPRGRDPLESLREPRRFYREGMEQEEASFGRGSRDFRTTGKSPPAAAMPEGFPPAGVGHPGHRSDSPPRRFYREVSEFEEESRVQDPVESLPMGHTGSRKETSTLLAGRGGADYVQGFSPRAMKPPQEPREFRRDTNEPWANPRVATKSEPMVEAKSTFRADMPPPRILQRPRAPLRSTEQDTADFTDGTAKPDLQQQTAGSKQVSSLELETAGSWSSANPADQGSLGPLFTMGDLMPSRTNGLEKSQLLPNERVNLQQETEASATAHSHQAETVQAASQGDKNSSCMVSVFEELACPSSNPSAKESSLQPSGSQAKRRRGGRRVREAEARKSERSAAVSGGMEGKEKKESATPPAGSGGEKRNGQVKDRSNSQKKTSVKGNKGHSGKDGETKIIKNLPGVGAKDQVHHLTSGDFLEGKIALGGEQVSLASFGSLPSGRKGSTNNLMGVPTYGADWSAGSSFGTSLSSIGPFSGTFAQTGQVPEWSQFGVGTNASSFNAVADGTSAALYLSSQGGTSEAPKHQHQKQGKGPRSSSTRSKKNSSSNAPLLPEQTNVQTLPAQGDKVKAKKKGKPRGKGSRGGWHNQHRTVEANETSERSHRAGSDNVAPGTE